MRPTQIALILVLLSPLGCLRGGTPDVPPGSGAVASSRGPQAGAPATAPGFGLIGQGNGWNPLDPALLQAESGAGVHYRLLELNWGEFQPNGAADWRVAAVTIVQTRIDAILASSPETQFYLDLGLQYPPAWAGAIDPLRDQYGNSWTASPETNGGANVYWSPTLRADVQFYLQKVFTTLNFHNRLWAVRIGPYMGELLYPEVAHAGQAESFWAFDATAQATSPVPGWRPGQPSPHGEAARFYNWYVDNLAHYFNFMLTEIRRYYAGFVAPVTPGKGMAPPAAASLIAGNLYDPAQAHYGTGNYWYRIFPEMGPDATILHWSSSVGDISALDENSANWWDWSSAKALAWLAHQSGRPVYAENPGHNAYDTSGGADPHTTMQWIFQALHDNGYIGLMWARESNMTDPAYASLAQYGTQIAAATACGPGFADVPAGSPFYAVIADLVARQAISGYGDCTFRPGSTITRAQVAKVLILALGLPLVHPAQPDFSDVPAASPFYPYVETAYTRGILAGYGDGTFRPDAPVTRAQLAKLVTTGRGWPPVAPPTPTFVDVPPSAPLYTFVETAYGHHVISGYNCGPGCLAFHPSGTATRGQGSKIIDLAITLP